MLHSPSQSTVYKGTRPRKSPGGRIPGKGAQDLRKPLRRRNGTQGCGRSQAALWGLTRGEKPGQKQGLEGKLLWRVNCQTPVENKC